MRSFKNIFLIVSAVAIFSSCNCHCEACLWLDKAYANVGDTVTLHNCSTDNLKDHGTWIFDDSIEVRFDATSCDSFKYVFTTPGNHTVSIEEGSNDIRAGATQHITIH